MHHSSISVSRSWQRDRHITDDIFKLIFWNENRFILIFPTSLVCHLKCSRNNQLILIRCISGRWRKSRGFSILCTTLACAEYCKIPSRLWFTHGPSNIFGNAIIRSFVLSITSLHCDTFRITEEPTGQPRMRKKNVQQTFEFSVIWNSMMRICNQKTMFNLNIYVYETHHTRFIYHIFCQSVVNRLFRHWIYDIDKRCIFPSFSASETSRVILLSQIGFNRRLMKHLPVQEITHTH